jgi:hypothetical protein
MEPFIIKSEDLTETYYDIISENIMIVKMLNSGFMYLKKSEP